MFLNIFPLGLLSSRRLAPDACEDTIAMLGPCHDLERKYAQQQGQDVAPEIGCKDDCQSHVLNTECQRFQQHEEEEGVYGIDEETALGTHFRQGVLPA